MFCKCALTHLQKLMSQLKAKEIGLSGVVEEYRVEASKVVNSLVKKHTKEREAAAQQFEAHRKELAQVLSGTRQRIHSMAADISAPDVGAIIAAIRQDKSLERLRAIQGIRAGE